MMPPFAADTVATDPRGAGMNSALVEEAMHEGIMRFASVNLLIALVVCVSCARNGGTTAEPVVSVATQGDYEAELRDAVRAYLQQEDRAQPELLSERPYHYKVYAQYPEGLESFEIDLLEQESRTTPMLAEVTIEKIRFSTRLHRDRNEAAADETFYRDTGTETVTFELRNGRWRRSGSLFVADRTEEYVNGQWVAVQAPPPRTVPGEEPQEGFFRRTFGWLPFL